MTYWYEDLSFLLLISEQIGSNWKGNDVTFVPVNWGLRDRASHSPLCFSHTYVPIRFTTTFTRFLEPAPPWTHSPQVAVDSQSSGTPIHPSVSH